MPRGQIAKKALSSLLQAASHNAPAVEGATTQIFNVASKGVRGLSTVAAR